MPPQSFLLLWIQQKKQHTVNITVYCPFRKDLTENHPALVTLPVDWDYTIPYGLLYAKEPSAEARLFIDAIK